MPLTKEGKRRLLAATIAIGGALSVLTAILLGSVLRMPVLAIIASIMLLMLAVALGAAIGLRIFSM